MSAITEMRCAETFPKQCPPLAAVTDGRGFQELAPACPDLLAFELPCLLCDEVLWCLRNPLPPPFFEGASDVWVLVLMVFGLSGRFYF